MCLDHENARLMVRYLDQVIFGPDRLDLGREEFGRARDQVLVDEEVLSVDILHQSADSDSDDGGCGTVVRALISV